MDEGIHLHVECRLAEVQRVQEAADGFLAQHDCPDEAAFRVRLVIEELITNVIKYAHKEGEGPLSELQFRLRRQAGLLIIRIDDDGSPFDPREAPAPNLSPHLEERRIGGLGLHLVRSLAERVDYERVGRWNRVEVAIRMDSTTDADAQ